MKNLCRLAVVIPALLFCARTHAATCPISAGASSATIVSTIQGCSSPNTVTFAAGTYSLAQAIRVPCGVSITGPTVAQGPYTTGDGYKHWGYTPTATINWTGAGGGGVATAFNFGSCTSTHSIKYLEVSMNHPSPDGGSVVYNGSVSSNVTIYGNYFHGNQTNTSAGGGSSGNDALIWFDGNSGASPDNNVTIEWNRLGGTGDCSNIMTDVGGNENGFCVGVGFHTNASNLTIENNTTYYQEQGQKFAEGGSPGSANNGGMNTCVNCTVEYNDWSNIHRIFFEEQINNANANTSASNPAVSLTTRYNSLHDPYYPTQFSFGLSVANGCTNHNPSLPGCVANTDGNVVIDNVATSPGAPFNGLGIEQWGSTGTTANYNLVQGEWSNSIDIAFDGAVVDSNNLIQSSFGAGGHNTPADCYPGYAGAFGWWAVEDSPANTPSGTGNVCNFVDGSVQTSVAPTISPASTSFATGITVTLTNPGTGRDVNTTIWYTTDGSTPGCASGTSQPIASGGTIAVSTTTTVKAIGMWGAPNQPCSYATGPLSGTFGYKPSAVVSATYTTGAPPTLNSVTLAAAGGATTITPAATVQINATCHYSNGVNTSCNTADVYGNAVSSWNSSNTNAVTINGSGLATGVAAGSATITATAAGVVSNPGIAITVTPAPVTLSSVTISGSPASIAVGATGQAALTCHYTDGSTTNCTTTDSHGNGPSSFSSSATAIATINSTGLYTGVAAGTTNLSAVVAGVTASPAFGLTVNPAPVTLSSVSLTAAGGATTLYLGATLQMTATCHYSDGSTTTCNQPDSHGNQVTAWNSTTTNVTMNSSGLATGAAIGTASVTATVTGGLVSPAYGLTVAAAPPTLTRVSLAGAGGAYTLYQGTTLQMTATCHYSDGSTTTCNQPDNYGNQVTAWNSTTTNVTINSSGLASGAAIGTASITATVTGGVVSPGYGLTVEADPVTLVSVSLTATGGATTLYLGATLQMITTCHYSDGSTTGCNQTDSHGNTVTAWNSTTANVTINSSGLATGAAIGAASVTATVTGGLVTPAYGLTVEATPLTLSSVSLATTGGANSIVAGTTNQLIATCTYSDGSSTNCGSAPDSHANIVTSWASSAPTIATVNGSGLVTGVAAGGTSVTASAIPAPTAIGSVIYATSSLTSTGIISYDYGMTGTSASSYTVGACNLYLPSGAYTAGSFYDCIVTPAPTPTTQAANALCSGRYTIPSSFAGGVWVSIPMSSCPALAPSSGYWVGQATNQSPSGPRGYSVCGSSCNGPVPNEGSGSYGYYYLSGNPFGQYTGMATTLTAGGASQDSIYLNLTTSAVVSPALALTVTAAPPTLASAYLSAAGSTVSVGGTLQMAAHCVYTNPAATTDCTVADIYGNAVSSWASSDITKATVGQVGGTNPGLVTAVAPGTVAITAVIDSELSSSSYPVTVPTPAVTLTGISIATTGGVTGLFVGGTNQLVATCSYSDGSTTNCTAADSHGNVASGYTSTAPAIATVNATSGLTTGVAPGTTMLTASAGGFTSPAFPLTVIAAPSGIYYITISGPVKFTGTVHF